MDNEELKHAQASVGGAEPKRSIVELDRLIYPYEVDFNCTWEKACEMVLEIEELDDREVKELERFKQIMCRAGKGERKIAELREYRKMMGQRK